MSRDTSRETAEAHETFRKRFWELLCSVRQVWYALIVANIILLVLLMMSLPAIEPGSATAVITRITFAFILTTIAFASYVFWKCK
jgi:hypothetical protein